MQRIRFSKRRKIARTSRGFIRATIRECENEVSQMIRFTIIGQPASKANSRQIVTIGGRPSSIKSKAARTFEDDSLPQIPIAARVELTVPVRATLHLYYASERSDLDESIVLDVLQTRWKKDKKTGERYCVQRGVYANDRLVREKHVFHHIDKANPRVEILIEPLEAVQAGLDMPELSRVGKQQKTLPLAADGNPF